MVLIFFANASVWFKDVWPCKSSPVIPKIAWDDSSSFFNLLRDGHLHRVFRCFSKSQVLWGGISGALAAWLTTPFDVIKTRVMTATQALTFGEALRSVATTGATGLFAGAGPRSAWWFCVSSVFFGTYERLRSSFQRKLEE